MYTDPRTHQKDPNASFTSSEEKQEHVRTSEHDTFLYLSEGSEFLDDAIRMKDQPFEESSDKEDQQSDY